MKKFILVLVIAIALIVPAAAQLRFDVGLYKPLGLGLTDLPEADSELATINETISSQFWLMIPEAAGYYELNLDPIPLRLGFGARAYTFLIAGAMWPNVMAELELGPVFVQAQVGGLLFGYYALNTIGGEFGNVVFPDLSVWFGLGQTKALKLGGGVTMFYAPELIESLSEATGRTIIPFIYYISGKFTIRP
jgi:hypothetical protein